MSPHLKLRIISRNNFNMFRMILNDSKLIENIKYASTVFNVAEANMSAIITEYKETGCVIIQSKMNYK